MPESSPFKRIPAFEMGTRHKARQNADNTRSTAFAQVTAASSETGSEIEPSRWAASLAVAAAQTVHGSRPPAQLHRWVTKDIYEGFLSKSQARARMARTGEQSRMHLQVKRIRICQPSDAAIEAAVVIDYGHRSRAVAIRLEWRRQRWIATVLDFL
jgi:hypothetical protein